MSNPLYGTTRNFDVLGGAFAQVSSDIPHLALSLKKPLRPLWISQQSMIWTNGLPDMAALPFTPLILVSASLPNARQHRTLSESCADPLHPVTSTLPLASARWPWLWSMPFPKTVLAIVAIRVGNQSQHHHVWPAGQLKFLTLMPAPLYQSSLQAQHGCLHQSDIVSMMVFAICVGCR